MYGKYRDILIKQGYIPVPLYGKATGIKGFLEPDYIPPTGFYKCNIGILCGQEKSPIYAIDIDINNKKIVEILQLKIFRKYGQMLCRKGKDPHVLFLYRSKPGIHKQIGRYYEIGHIEILGLGQHATMYGTHEDTGKPYTWGEVELAQWHISRVPYLPPERASQLLHDCQTFIESQGYKPKTRLTFEHAKEQQSPPGDPLDECGPLGLTSEEIQYYLSYVDPDSHRDIWIGIGMAIHHETSGKGFALWDAWSALGSKYDKDDIKVQWSSFGKSTRIPLTARYLLKIAYENGAKSKKKSSVQVSSMIYAPELDGIPTCNRSLLELHGQRVLSEGSLSLLSGPAGHGKTQILSAICAAVSEPFGDIDTLGFTSIALSTIYIDTEQSRYEHYQTWRKYLRRIDPMEESPGSQLVKFRMITELEDLQDRKAFLFDILNSVDPPSLVILDGIGDLVTDVNNSEECIPFLYKLLAILKRKEIGILTTLHVNPSANTEKMRGVLGSELWRKAECSMIIQNVAGSVRKLTTDYVLGKNRGGYDKLSTYYQWSSEHEIMVSCPAPLEERQDPIDIERGIMKLLSLQEDNCIRKSALIEVIPATKTAIQRTLLHLYLEDKINMQKVTNDVLISTKENINL